VIVALVGILGLIFLGFGVVRLLHRGATMRTEAQHYLDRLSAGNVDAAYRHLCPQAQAQVSLAEFRAEQEYRIGDHGHVVQQGWPIRKSRVDYRTDRGSGQLRVVAVHGYWTICPHSDELPPPSAAGMSPEQRLEANIARSIRTRGLAPNLVSVSCPALPALVDGTTTRCDASSMTDGFTVIATESHGTSQTTVRVTRVPR
jgi:hypothetical protein